MSDDLEEAWSDLLPDRSPSEPRSMPETVFKIAGITFYNLGFHSGREGVNLVPLANGLWAVKVFTNSNSSYNRPHYWYWTRERSWRKGGLNHVPSGCSFHPRELETEIALAVASPDFDRDRFDSDPDRGHARVEDEPR